MKTQIYLMVLIFFTITVTYVSSKNLEVTVTITKKCNRNISSSNIIINRTSYETTGFLNIVVINSVNGTPIIHKAINRSQFKYTKQTIFTSIRKDSILVIVQNNYCIKSRKNWISFLPETMKNQISNDAFKSKGGTYFKLCKGNCPGFVPQVKNFVIKKNDNLYKGSISLTIQLRYSSTPQPTSSNQKIDETTAHNNHATLIMIIVILITLIILMAAFILYWKRKSVLKWVKRSNGSTARRNPDLTNNCEPINNCAGSDSDSCQVYETLPRIRKGQITYPENIYSSAENSYECPSDDIGKQINIPHGSKGNINEREDTNQLELIKRNESAENQCYVKLSKDIVKASLQRYEQESPNSFPPRTPWEFFPSIHDKQFSKNNNNNSLELQSEFIKHDQCNEVNFLQPKSNTSNDIYNLLEPESDKGENMYNSLELKDNNQELYKILEPKSNKGENIYNLLKPEDNNEDLYNILEPESDKGENIYNLLKPDDNDEDLYNTLEPESDKDEDIYNILKPDDNNEDLYSTLETDSDKGENIYNLLKPEDTNEDLYNILEPESDKGENIYNLLKPDDNDEDLYNTLEPDSDKGEDIYNLLKPEDNNEDLYNILEPESDKDEDIYNVLEKEQNTENIYKDLELESNNVEGMCNVLKSEDNSQGLCNTLEPESYSGEDLHNV